MELSTKVDSSFYTNFCLARGGGQPLRRIVKVKEENKDSRICIFCLFGNWIALHIFCSLGPRSKRLQIIRVRWSKRDASFTVDVLSPVHSICHPWQIAADYKRIIKTLYVAVETLTKYMQSYPISIQVTNANSAILILFLALFQSCGGCPNL